VKVCVLGTGSAGNATLVEVNGTRILVDAGFSGREMERRLCEIGLTPKSVDAIVITHDHRDHTHGAGIFSRRHGTPVFITDRTRAACSGVFRGTEPLRPYQAGRVFEIGGISVEPFLTVHDAADPIAVALVDRDTGRRVGIATDLGRPNTQIRLALENSDFLILESNHDEELLRTSRYPASVQQRIASSHGHLSNHAAARFACELLHPRLAGVLLAHLSQECNRPELALAVVGGALRGAGFQGFLAVALQDQPTDFIDIEELRERTGPAQFTLL
jgi:phosphoribosyl 1,2-cyclic phosphodiesterase